MKDVDDEALVERAVALADALLRASWSKETRATRRRAARVARMLDDEAGKAFALALTDQALRIRDPRRAAVRFRALVAEGTPSFLGPVDRLLLQAGAALAPLLPRVVMPMVAARLRSESRHVVLPAERAPFVRHARRRRRGGVRLNVNVLGEAILGEEEARRRTAAVIERLTWPDVDYVSVKISALCSQLDVLAFDQSVERIASRLREVFTVAKQASPAKFVNLDMEEYRDLGPTVAVFRKVLDEPGFFDLDAGIVLQAYLPDSFTVLGEVAQWARQRRERGGGRIKVRLVKGANLAMEQVDAELHGWAQAPYASKAEVDANYKRMLDLVLEPQYADSVRVGVASHNLFEVAWALVRADASGQSDRVEIEMLEGMAEAQAQATRDRTGDLLLYAPVARRDDFESSIAYLVRRLDENTAPENFLRRLFSLQPGSPGFEVERQRFVEAVRDRGTVSDRPRREQDRGRERRTFGVDEPFANEPDTDFTLPANRAWVREHMARFRSTVPPVVPASVAGEDVLLDDTGTAVDPSAPGSVSYRYALADVPTVDRAVATARQALPAWRALSSADRRALLVRVAEVMAARRGESVAAMAHDAGKTPVEADPEVSEAIDFARWYAGGTRTIDQLTAEGLAFDPLGVVVVASPWNFPYAIPAGGVLAALAAGNTVILKPAPETVLTAGLVARHCWEAGVPRDVLQFLPCPDDDVGRRLVTHPGVDAVILTGAWETAQLFRSWRPQLRLHAETSGKNAVVVTQAADLDAAVRDIVRSAFGHAGQKCSAASLALVEGPVYDDPVFRRQLRDAVTSLVVGPAWAPGTAVGPLVRPPEGPLAEALRTLAPGESWLVEPRMVDGNPHLWSPGVKLGVQPGSWFHRTECFGPVLGVMRADDLDHAIRLQNATAFGLTGGIQSLDDDEVEHWLARVEVGNAYVNRHITGAIVQRQPFGGWKRSVVGPAAKAGGPNYVLGLGRWRDAGAGVGDAVSVAERFAAAWRQEFAVEHDGAGLRAESNVLRYRPYARGVAIRAGADAPDDDVAVALLAARTAGVEVVVSSAVTRHGVDVPVIVEDDDSFAVRLAGLDLDKVRVLGAVPDVVRKAAHATGIALDDEGVVRHPRIELLRWVREQAVSRTRHRYGNVVGPRR